MQSIVHTWSINLPYPLFIANYMRKDQMQLLGLTQLTYRAVLSVRSPTGGVVVSCQDLSRNGIAYNGQTIKKSSVILMDGDILSLPGPTRIGA